MSTLAKPQWLIDWEKTNNRPLRVLHVGNIANNAYLNAKLMRRVGIHADVACYDYYHVMGTPEWEDADFDGDVGDYFFPDWWRADLQGFKRPDWFYQGPKEFVRDALIAQFTQGKNSVQRDTAEFFTHYVCFSEADLSNTPKTQIRRRTREFWLFAATYCLKHPSIIPRLFRHKARSNLFFRTIVTVVDVLIGSIKGISALIALIGSIPALLATRLKPRAKTRDNSYLSYRLRQIRNDFLEGTIEPIIKLASRVFKRITGRAFSEVFGADFRTLARLRTNVEDEFATGAEEEVAPEYAEHLTEIYLKLARRVRNDQHWFRKHIEWHQTVPMDELRGDYRLAKDLARGWEHVFTHYDVIQCYAVDGILPMTTAHAFCAYEHGTIREIPFDGTQVGRLTATAYRSAHAAMVTNLDNLEKAQRLELAPCQVVSLPHALDDSKLYSHQDLYVSQTSEQAVVFFSPSRHDWLDGDPNFAKGNDRFLKAAAILREEGYKFELHLIAWGRHLEDSKQLVEELGLETIVQWSPPLKKAELWGRMLDAHAIVDQFIIPAFGSVTFEALVFGKRVISNLDINLATEFFSEPPPMLVSSEVDSVVHAMRAVLDDPDDHGRAGCKAAEWAKKFHSSARVLELQLDAYRGLV